MKTKFVCRLSSVVCLAAALVSSAADVKYQDFQWEKNSLVPFDATTTVTLECPDPAAAFAERTEECVRVLLARAARLDALLAGD